jgi:hypothetical protein
VPRILKPSREYHETLRRAGVKNPGEVSYQVPVQLTAQVDDLSYLKPPIVTVVAGGGFFLPAVAGQFNINCEIECRSRGGMWILAVANSSPAATAYLDLYTSPVSLITLGSTVFPPDFVTPVDGSVPRENVFRYGTAGVGVTWPMRFLQRTAVWNFPPLWVGFGTFCGIKCATANQASNGWLLCREIPVGAPGDA